MSDTTTREKKLERACIRALCHVSELREAWRSGALSEHDGLGGLRSNRNVEIEGLLIAALEDPEMVERARQAMRDGNCVSVQELLDDLRAC